MHPVAWLAVRDPHVSRRIRKPDSRLCYADEAADFLEVTAGRRWSFDGDGNLLRLVSEARRIQLRISSTRIWPFTRLWFHLCRIKYRRCTSTCCPGSLFDIAADDPGAGKTIMAGLLIREMLIAAIQEMFDRMPRSLVEQWQDELGSRFQLPFEILTNDRIEASRTGNPFTEINLMIARLDKLSRNEEAQIKLGKSDWDLIVCDESHKMSASFFGGEIKETKRTSIGKLWINYPELLVDDRDTAQRKEEDFQLFLALLDGDRFEGKFRDGVHVADTSTHTTDGQGAARHIEASRCFRNDARTRCLPVVR